VLLLAVPDEEAVEGAVLLGLVRVDLWGARRRAELVQSGGCCSSAVVGMVVSSRWWWVHQRVLVIRLDRQRLAVGPRPRERRPPGVAGVGEPGAEGQHLDVPGGAPALRARRGRRLGLVVAGAAPRAKGLDEAIAGEGDLGARGELGSMNSPTLPAKRRSFLGDARSASTLPPHPPPA
jgi:hypothetical protein